jgi:hypothetical protein
VTARTTGHNPVTASAAASGPKLTSDCIKAAPGDGNSVRTLILTLLARMATLE